MKKLYFLLIILSAITFSQSCYYDSEERIYPPACDTCSNCDVSAVTYDTEISTIISDHCISCHSGAAPSGGAGFETKPELAGVINDPASNFLCRIKWESGCGKMPQSGSKLSDCSILKIETWITNGMP